MRRARLALGTAQFGNAYGIANSRGRLANAEIGAILDAAFERGVRCLDTAAAYGDAEERIGEFFARRGTPDGLAICSKSPRLAPGLAPQEVDRVVGDALDGSRRRLRVDAIDVYLVHDANDLRRYGTLLIETLVRRRESGSVGCLGVSVYDPEDAALLSSHPELTAIQYPFNLFDRRATSGGGVERWTRKGVATFARSPLLQGLLTLRPGSLPATLVEAAPWLAKLERLCAAHGTTPFAAALTYAAERSGAGHVVLGVESVEQLDHAVTALGQPLSPALGEEIDRVFGEVPASVLDPRRWGAMSR